MVMVVFEALVLMVWSFGEKPCSTCVVLQSKLQRGASMKMTAMRLG